MLSAKKQMQDKVHKRSLLLLFVFAISYVRQFEGCKSMSQWRLIAGLSRSLFMISRD
jgi:hypothetical protein